MAETMTPIEPYRHDANGDPEYLITSQHTLNDILRWLIGQAGGKEEIRMLLDGLSEGGE